MITPFLAILDYDIKFKLNSAYIMAHFDLCSRVTGDPVRKIIFTQSRLAARYFALGRKQQRSAQRAGYLALIDPTIQTLPVKHMITVARFPHLMAPFYALQAYIAFCVPTFKPCVFVENLTKLHYRKLPLDVFC
ncbi:hypothetical protein DVH24_008366 [Malus domestica]|uniref:Uncharacterized protein n=1 Tax=Malus domestica TaxID=3750 RepID=A0A498JLD3_MALDO|nr:hypothetical protein DVH24_008366 [Malus domestica]